MGQSPSAGSASKVIKRIAATMGLGAQGTAPSRDSRDKNNLKEWLGECAAETEKRLRNRTARVSPLPLNDAVQTNGIWEVIV